MLVMNNRRGAIGLSLGKGNGRLMLQSGMNEVDGSHLDAVENQDYLHALLEDPLPGLGGRCALEMQQDKPIRKKSKSKKPDAE